MNIKNCLIFIVIIKNIGFLNESKFKFQSVNRELEVGGVNHRANALTFVFKTVFKGVVSLLDNINNYSRELPAPTPSHPNRCHSVKYPELPPP